MIYWVFIHAKHQDQNMELKYEEYKIKKLFINMLLKKGKKTCSENIFKNILINLKKTTKQKPNFILFKSIDNLLPKLKAISIPNKKRNKKKKKDRYFLMLLNEDKQIKKSVSWLLLNTNLKNLTSEIIQTSKNKSKTINTKKQYYKNIKKLKFNLIFD
uniref:Ribosomal protein S7 n=4 Tax=Phytophthora TaxID=4783 RepID=Q9T245_PHYIN|nr:ribosomal protein S7 [Phytophthora infestans]YP_004563947.1 ribosomal protein S7 [Phytophthora mirabilis]YP_004564453.1 ribosomal protein S7 [Phytophthora ipomoeae]AHW51440.1 ribosomal protein S7 [Phytophthora andina]AAF24785.1 ribosomal protein S7 [Phytophthora infestans]AAW62555.1 ribosomal protein S7 [Phytophthora infestans]AAW67041.1 ribosomal protein S7 [Phytophthora infestans]AAW67087.1 ribosomal protein S7 [Phytophthora infestans]